MKNCKFQTTKRFLMRIKKIENTVRVYRKQNTILIKKIGQLIINQKHYLSNRVDNTKKRNYYLKEISNYRNSREKIDKFLGLRHLPKCKHDPKRPYFVRLSNNEYSRLLRIVR